MAFTMAFPIDVSFAPGSPMGPRTSCSSARRAPHGRRGRCHGRRPGPGGHGRGRGCHGPGSWYRSGHVIHIVLCLFVS